MRTTTASTEQQQQPHKVATSDIVLLLSIVFLLGDLTCEWDKFADCPKPIHLWLFLSYLLLVVSRIIMLVAVSFSSARAGLLLIDLRPKTTQLSFALSTMWFVVIPLFVVWSILGAAWTYEVFTSAPECLPSMLHTWFLVIWQVMSNAWILLYSGLGIVAWVLEFRLRRAENNLRQIEDAEVLERWGRVSVLDGYMSLPAEMASAGLTATQIQQLPVLDEDLMEDASMDLDCSICLTALRGRPTSASSLRSLHACGHVFHRPCIDLWLLRSAECPLCKVKVSVDDGFRAVGRAQAG